LDFAMAFGEHRDERLRGGHGRLPASIDRINVPLSDEMRQVQVGQVAARRAVNRVVLRPDEDSELRGDAGVRRELAEVRGRAPGLDAQEHAVHVAPFEDVILDHGGTDLLWKIVLRHEREDPSILQYLGDQSSFVESPLSRAWGDVDE